MSRRDDQQAARLPGAWTLTRDILSFAFGWLLIFLEVQRPEVRDAVLVFAGSVASLPGIVVGATSVADVINRRRGGTPEQQSPPVEQAGSLPQ